MVDALGDQIKDYFNEAYPYFIASHQQKPAEELVSNHVFSLIFKINLGKAEERSVPAG